jgi:hypothetical protein
MLCVNVHVDSANKAWFPDDGRTHATIGIGLQQIAASVPFVHAVEAQFVEGAASMSPLPPLSTQKLAMSVILSHLAMAAAAGFRHSHCPAMLHGHQVWPVPPVDVEGAQGAHWASVPTVGGYSGRLQWVNVSFR